MAVMIIKDFNVCKWLILEGIKYGSEKNKTDKI